VAVLVCFMLPVLMGIAVLTIDVGVLYNTRADLQRAADAGAMAAAAALSNCQFSRDPLELAREEAIKLVEANPVLGQKITIDPQTDVIFGRGNYDPVSNTYDFVPTSVLPDAVRVRVRCTDDSPNGPADLFFAGFFGKANSDVSASATAAITPRDIVVTADISGSLRFDSLLKYYRTKRINNYDVWDALPGGADEIGWGVWEPDELPADLTQAAGPGWGFFKKLYYGYHLSSTYRPSDDPGFIELKKSHRWNSADLADYVRDLGYNDEEIDAILKPYNERYYRNRAAVALGLVYWNSGMSGGLWENRGVRPSAAGNGNRTIGDGELEGRERLFDNSLSYSKNIWRDYTNYMRNERNFRYRFGAKTFVDYLIMQRVNPSLTPELAHTPLQPLQAIKDAITFMAGLLTERDTTDLVSLTTYSTKGIHRVDLTDNFLEVSDRLNEMSPYGSTNMGAGLERAIEELTGPRNRLFMRKVIVLITDGYANIDRHGRSSSGRGKHYAIEEAERAAELGIQIITVSVGQDSDQNLMKRIAKIGHGDHFHVEGSVEEYSADLIDIFTQIGGRRLVDLIE